MNPAQKKFRHTDIATLAKLEVKQWAEDTAEKSVDKIILNYKNNLITKETAISEIMKVDNLQMIGIDENNVEEVIEDTFYDKVAS